MESNDACQRLNCLTGRQVGLLKKSFRQMDPGKVATRFYADLFEKHPGVKPLFSGNMSELMDKMMCVLELVVFSFEEKSQDNFKLQDSLIIPLRVLGKKHDQLGIIREHYVLTTQLLLNAIREETGASFTEDMSRSWGIALDHLAFVMQDSSLDFKLEGIDSEISVIGKKK
jgi:hemoglobin-like flavoprotein